MAIDKSLYQAPLGMTEDQQNTDGLEIEIDNPDWSILGGDAIFDDGFSLIGDGTEIELWGNIYIDLEGVIKGLNNKTGDTCEIKCTPRNWTESSQISGFCADKDGNIIYQITGRW